jgi:hypothetical protein
MASGPDDALTCSDRNQHDAVPAEGRRVGQRARKERSQARAGFRGRILMRSASPAESDAVLAPVSLAQVEI